MSLPPPAFPGYQQGIPPTLPPRNTPRPMAPAGTNNRRRREIPPQMVDDLVGQAYAAITNNNQQNLERSLLKLHKIGRKYSAYIGTMLLDRGVGELVLTTYRTYPQNPRIIAISNQIIRYLKGNIYKLFREGGGVEVLRSMNDLRSDKNVQAGGCYAIRTFARLKFNAMALMSEDYNAIYIIEQAMTLHEQDAEVQKAACSAIWCLCTFDETKELVWRSGITRNIILALNTHRKMPKVQEYGVQVLKGFTCIYSVVRLGGAEVMIEALKNHPSVPTLAKPVFKGLRQFCAYPCNADVLEKLDAARYIVVTMNILAKNKKIQFDGLGTIYQMAHWTNLRTALFNNRVGRVFQTVLANSAKDEKENVFPHCLMCVKKFCDEERYVRQFLTLLIHTYIADASLVFLRAKKMAIVENCLEVLIEFCTTLVGARQPVKSTNIMLLIGDLEALYAYAPAGQKAAELKALLL